LRSLWPDAAGARRCVFLQRRATSVIIAKNLTQSPAAEGRLLKTKRQRRRWRTATRPILTTYRKHALRTRPPWHGGNALRRLH
jgi:hypothetical protein